MCTGQWLSLRFLLQIPQRLLCVQHHALPSANIFCMRSILFYPKLEIDNICFRGQYTIKACNITRTSAKKRYADRLKKANPVIQVCFSIVHVISHGKVTAVVDCKLRLRINSLHGLVNCKLTVVHVSAMFSYDVFKDRGRGRNIVIGCRCHWTYLSHTISSGRSNDGRLLFKPILQARYFVLQKLNIRTVLCGNCLLPRPPFSPSALNSSIISVARLETSLPLHAQKRGSHHHTKRSERVW
mmetsp:Transcript_75902/g.162830  ORF Transcript_75902/g.162830 Transcript_75902/m.162830 type:complete len:241 (+) Transcript_75902:185-907(+)